MKIEKPSGAIKPQTQTSLPTNSDSTIMDDTTALMDDTSALMGGLTVSLPTTRQTIVTTKPAANIKIGR